MTQKLDIMKVFQVEKHKYLISGKKKLRIIKMKKLSLFLYNPQKLAISRKKTCANVIIWSLDSKDLMN